MDARHEIGRRGELIVAQWLEARGYRLLGRNVRVGRLELDIIARRGGLVVVCEVRCRTDDRLVSPVETIDRAKAERVRRAAWLWLQDQPPHVRSASLRFDAASVVLGPPGREPRVDYYEDAL